MAWQRSIPFGYCMEHAVIRSDPEEAEAVKHIFSLYSSGHSLDRIAKAMTASGPRYHKEKDQWNIGMVKRILENRKYLGDEGYPAIIEDEIYQQVQRLKEKKTLYSPCPSVIAAAKDKAVCNECGETMKRTPVGHGIAQWQCQNPQCLNIVRFSDDELSRRIEHCLQMAAKAPEALKKDAPQPAYQTIETIRLENEFRTSLNRNGENPEYLKTLIFALAAEKYALLPDDSLSHRMRSLCWNAIGETPDRTALLEILNGAVSAVYVGRNRALALRLINGKLVTEEGEVK